MTEAPSPDPVPALLLHHTAVGVGDDILFLWTSRSADGQWQIAGQD